MNDYIDRFQTQALWNDGGLILESLYQPAIDRIKRATPKRTFFATTSVPCFEYWLLLHFQYTTRPYEALQGNSAGNQVLRALKAVMPDYEKGKLDIFPMLLDQIEFAKHNAVRALEAGKSARTDNPTTNVHELVEYLQNVKCTSDIPTP
ncbi:MAG: RloB family protein [Mariprofundaceae bacterium]|nr:RloB family protein [Mariprofundaceae bacterium]